MPKIRFDTLLFAQVLSFLVAVSPVQDLAGSDVANDQGGVIRLSWTAPTDSAPLGGFRIYRSQSSDTGFTVVGDEAASASEFLDGTARDGQKYFYRVVALAPADSAGVVADSVLSVVTGPVSSKAQWFNASRLNILIFSAIICGLFIFYIQRARKGEKMLVRKIAGLDAIDDALGRATEMGKPIMFSFGLGYITDMVVIAALPLLRKVAMKSAEYSTRLLVPNSDPIVMTAAQETVKEAYTEMGRPDFYSADNVNFLTSDQFGYAAGVDGIILREKPGAIFWLGYFYAESLIMAETGHSVGAIQLAGTTETTQLPFFVAACDYTMIGEEIYAASCYLRPEPVMLGTLKGEDFIRFWLIVLTTAAVVMGTLAAILAKQAPWLQTAYDTVVKWATPAY